jgi:GT2 family glycosyltransferase
VCLEKTIGESDMKKYLQKAGHLVTMVQQVYQKRGLKSLVWRIGEYLFGRRPMQIGPSEYAQWIEQNETLTKDEAQQEMKSWQSTPKISLLTPVFNVDPKWLDACFESVVGQWYENWEFCLHDDASTKEETKECLRKWAARDARIKVSYGKENGHISYATNQAAKLATGEFFALLDNDDELSLNALYEAVKVLNAHPETDLLYSDEDKLELDGTRVEPYFKPDWSSEFFMSTNYLSHLIVGRMDIFHAIGGYRIGYEGSQDYDLLLRFIEKAREIRHISKILYHWRKIPGSTADRPDSKNYAYEAAQKAIRDSLERSGIAAEVSILTPGFYRAKRTLLGNPKVSIIVPFRDQCAVLRRCIESILEKTTYQNYEVLLVDNQSSEDDTLAYMKEIEGMQDTRLRVLRYNKPFNFSAINNFAAKQATGEYFLLLNNDTEVITGEWLSAMLEYARQENVGAVGAKLWYPNDTIQHAGVIMGISIAGHAFKAFPKEHPGYFNMLNVAREYSAVTGACLLTRKSLFDELGGLNEQELAVAYNDVDYCLRVREAGYKVIYTPFAELYHYESLSRGYDDVTEEENPEKYRRVMAEQNYMHAHWQNYIDNDPCYSPHLSRKFENFSLHLKSSSQKHK